MNEIQALAHRHAEMVHEFERRGAGAAFLAIDDDEVRRGSALQHGLANGEKLDRLS